MRNRKIVFHGGTVLWGAQFVERGPNELKTGHFSRPPTDRGLWLPAPQSCAIIALRKHLPLFQ